MGVFFSDEPYTLGRVPNGTRTRSGGRKLKNTFAETAVRGVFFLAPAWHLGAAPCFLFEERAENEG